MKKAIVIMMAVMVFLTGCQKAAEQTKAELTPAGEFPISKEKAVIKVFAGKYPGVEDLDTNKFTQKYEEKTNVHIEWEQVPYEQIKEKANIILSSGDYPDVFMGAQITNSQLVSYGEQGIFLPLNDLIENNSKYFKELLEKEAWIKDQITTPNGKIYTFPMAHENYHMQYPYKFWMYKPWLTELGLEVPTTTDELYTVLKAFKERDPNKNGKADEIPLAGSKGSTAIDIFLMNSFVYNDGSLLQNNDGTLEFISSTEGYRNGLRYLTKLYKEGLIAPESFTMDNTQLRQMGENPDVVILGAAPALYYGDFTQDNGASGRYLDYVPVAPLKGPDGVQYAATYPYSIGNHMQITNKCADPELVMRWVDWLYTSEAKMELTFGYEGEHWKKADAGQVGLNDKPAVFQLIKKINDQQQNETIRDTVPNHGPMSMIEGMYIEDRENYTEYKLINTTRDFYDPYRYKMPAYSPYYTSEQATEVAQVSAPIGNFVTSSLAKFVTGEMDIETDWDSYVAELEKMNVKRFVQIQQEAYDAKNKK